MARSNLRDAHAQLAYGLRAIDVVLIVLTGLVAFFFRFGTDGVQIPESYRYALVVGAAISLPVFSEFGLYRNLHLPAGYSAFSRLLAAWVVVFACLATITYLSKTGIAFSRVWFGCWGLLGFVALVVARILYRMLVQRFARQGVGVRRVLVVGTPESCETVLGRIRNASLNGLMIVDTLYYQAAPANAALPDGRAKAGISENSGVVHFGNALGQRVEEMQADEVWLTWPMSQEAMIKLSLEALQDRTVNIRWVADLFSFRMFNHGVTDFGGLPLYDLSVSPLSGMSLVKKEFLDRMLSALILMLAGPLMLLIAVGVRLSGPGPIFHRQERVGWNNKPFMMLKFRSMAANAEGDGVVWGNADAKAVTSFGRFLRRSGLDELPQFFNVLKGDMSIVGPRPERSVFVDEFKHVVPNYMKKHMVKAGITGWAQVNGFRGDTDLGKRIELDLYYIDNWSIGFDLRIMLMTPVALLAGLK